MRTGESRQRKVAISIVFAMLIVIGTVLYWFTLHQDDQASLATSLELEAEFTSSDADARLVDAANAVKASSTLWSGWTVASKDTVPPEKLPQYQATFHDAELVQLDTDIWSWQKGERVAFNLPHISSTIDFLIERAEPGLGGSRSYIGSHHDGMEIYPVVVTVGFKNTFVYIGSAKGSFEMVGNREFGWLMPTEAMERHVDYSKPDYVVPGEEHEHQR